MESDWFRHRLQHRSPPAGALQVRSLRGSFAHCGHQQGSECTLSRRGTTGSDVRDERVMDLIAAELGVDPAVVRMRNLIPLSEMPYRLVIPYRDGEPIVYDSGDYPESLRQALSAIGGLEAFRERQNAARAQGRFLGLGLGCYVEGTGVGPFESATVRIDPSGKIYLAGGACPQGQGMETIFAQVVADTWSVDPENVVISLADTAAIAIGFGTIASRSTVTLSA